MLSRRRLEPEGGFTLIELVLTVALLGIIGGAIVTSFLVMLSTSRQSSNSLDASRDQQFLATYFTDDAAGLQSVSEGSQTVCGSAVTALVVFTGTDFSPSADPAVGTARVTRTTAWVYRPATADLVRTTCVLNGAPDTRVVARDLPSSPTVSASCSTTTTVTGSPVEVAIRVPSNFGTTAALCGKRRSGA